MTVDAGHRGRCSCSPPESPLRHLPRVTWGRDRKDYPLGGIPVHLRHLPRVTWGRDGSDGVGGMTPDPTVFYTQ